MFTKDKNEYKSLNEISVISDNPSKDSNNLNKQKGKMQKISASLKAAIQKMALCINEFTGSDKLSRSDKGKKIFKKTAVFALSCFPEMNLSSEQSKQ